MADTRAYDVVTFDCYGTLIDWERGIAEAFIEAARIFASYGLASEYPVQRYFRDARFLLPGGGTSEILRVVIGRDLDWDRGQVLS